MESINIIVIIIGLPLSIVSIVQNVVRNMVTTGIFIFSVPPSMSERIPVERGRGDVSACQRKQARGDFA